MKAVVASIAAIAAIAAAGSAAAQDWRLPANYGSVTLYSGFTPDPFEVNVVSGGQIDASAAISSSCRGWIANSPDFELTYSAGSLPLIISVNSSADTTLVINGPDGRWYCDDDGGTQGMNPSLRWGTPPSGTYDIWVGSYQRDNFNAVLSISELYTY